MANEKYCKQLSILIPVYNYECTALVASLQKQAEALCIDYEIIVADDGSSDSSTVKANRIIADIPHCTYIQRKENVGRAAIRNYLSRRASFGWMIFLDCDIALPDDNFIERYLYAGEYDVIDGGVCTDMNAAAQLAGNIRYIYEHSSESQHTAVERTKNPYRSFRTTNFMIRQEVMISNRFDERFKYYGYEDVLFGKRLQENGYKIYHIENPVVIRDFDSNETFISKTEESLRTLFLFHEELSGYSRLLTNIDRLRRFIPLWTIKLWHTFFGKLERHNLTGTKPNLLIFDLYKLGYYLSLTNKKLKQ